MMMEKFKVGQKVYCIMGGLGTVKEITNQVAPIHVYLDNADPCHRQYFSDGRFYPGHKNPTLLTLEEARAKGYDVPKQKIVKEKTVYINLYPDHTGLGSIVSYSEKLLAEKSANYTDALVVAYPVTIKYEVEE